MSILYLTGTRSEYGLMRRTLLEIKKKYKLFLIVTGTHMEKKFGYTVKEIIKDSLPVWKRIKLPHVQTKVHHMRANQSFLERKLDHLLGENHFDACLVEGDRYESLAMAKIANKHGILVIHQGGGDVSGSIDDKIRNKITAYANIHLAGSVRSAQNLKARGIRKNTIYMLGEPGLDAIAHKTYTPARMVRTTYSIDLKKKLILCAMHPDTTSRISLRRQIEPILLAIKELRVPTIIIYPNGDAGSIEMIDEIEKLRKEPYVHIFPSIVHKDFLGLLAVCDVFIGNSSSGLIETPLLNIPFINIGNRQNGRLTDTNVTHVKHNTKEIVAAVRANLDVKNTFKIRYVYGRGNFTSECMKVLQHYLHEHH